MFWLLFWVNVAVAAALMWSIRAYRETFTYRMDVSRTPSLEDAVDEVNADARQEAIVGMTDDDFISLGAAQDAGLAEIAQRGDVAVFVREDAGSSVIDLYVTPKARYQLARRASPVYGRHAALLDAGVIYAVEGAGDALGTVRIPSGSFEALPREEGVERGNEVRGVYGFLPSGSKVFFLRGCAVQPCDVLVYDIGRRTVSPVALGLVDDPLGALSLHSYDARRNVLRITHHVGDGGAAQLTEYDLEVDTGRMLAVATYATSGPCSGPDPEEKACTPADVAAARRYAARVAELGLLAHEDGPPPSQARCGDLIMDFDARRGRFLGCLSYDPEMWRAVQSATIKELDAVINE